MRSTKSSEVNEAAYGDHYKYMDLQRTRVV